MLTRQRKWPKSEWKRRRRREEGVTVGGEREESGRGEGRGWEGRGRRVGKERKEDGRGEGGKRRGRRV